jgi:serine/threonine protein kinase|mmetsp:Transcript_117691/g.186313  ORF Transcript_117691/g.186313 Transcript_117691/m.186313 type:complete len:748 (+) Transcript_117691:100-2343(+)
MFQFPSLWLHPLHTFGDAEPAPLVEGLEELADSEALVVFAKQTVEADATFAEGLSMWKHASHNLGLDKEHRSRLRITDMKDGGECAEHYLELLMCEIERFQVASSGSEDSPGELLDLLVVGRRQQCPVEGEEMFGLNGPFGAAWIIIVEGGELALRYVMAHCGSCGAIRSDLHEAYELSIDPIGSGSFSAVYSARIREPNSSWSALSAVGAMKVLTNGTSTDTSVLALSEASLLLAVQQHPNIVGIYDIFRYRAGCGSITWALHLEMCLTGDLHTDIVHNGAYDEIRAASLLYGLLSALSHVHAKGLVHRDVKAENILLMKKGRPALSDFGITARADDEKAMQRRCGSPGYAAPELLAGKPYGEKIDVFSAGVVLYFIVSCSMPFSGSDIASILRRTLRCHVKFDPAKFGKVTENFKKFLLMLICSDPDERASAECALELLRAFYGDELRVQHLCSTQTPAMRALSAWIESQPYEKDNFDNELRCTLDKSFSDNGRISGASTGISLLSERPLEISRETSKSSVPQLVARVTDTSDDARESRGSDSEVLVPRKPSVMPYWKRRLQNGKNQQESPQDPTPPVQQPSGSRPDRSERYRFQTTQNETTNERKRGFRRLNLGRLRFTSNASRESDASESDASEGEGRGWNSWNSEVSRLSERLSSWSSRRSRSAFEDDGSEHRTTFTRIEPVREEPEDPCHQSADPLMQELAERRGTHASSSSADHRAEQEGTSRFLSAPRPPWLRKRRPES